MIKQVLVGVGTAAAAAAIEPIELVWGVAMAVAVGLSVLGAFFDAHSNSRVRGGYLTLELCGSIGMSAITAAVFFSMIRSFVPDSLQLAMVSGVCGIYGRRALEPLAFKVFDKLGIHGHERKNKSPAPTDRD